MVEDSAGEGGLQEPSPWVEVINVQNDSLLLSDYYLTADTLNDGDDLMLPAIKIAPGNTVIIYFFPTNYSVDNAVYIDFELSSAATYLALFNRKTQTMEDMVERSDFPRKNESLGRFPNGGFDKYYFKEHLITPGRKNPHPGPWRKITTNADFSPRDSSPNACVVHNDSVWVLAGYRYANGVWDSSSDVWKSGDGINWELVNDTPPYFPYCSFVSFRNRIWAFGESSYNSEDGAQWNEVSTNMYLGYGMKVVQFHGKLIAINGRTILSSTDGINWKTVTTTAPWSARNWPGLVELNGRLYFLGGGVDYFTGHDYYYRDVWASDDGFNWGLLTDAAPFQEGLWVRYESFENKLWAMGGWNYYQLHDEFSGNNNEIWISENGIHWKKLEVNPVWSPRHAMLAYVFKNSLHVSSGYGTQGLETLYNDVWQFSRIPQEISRDTIVATYGDPPFPVTASSGLPVDLQSKNSVVVRLNGSDVGIRSAGQEKILATQEGSAIYLPVQKEIIVSVNKKELIVKPDSHAMAFGEENPIVNFTYEGFVGQDDSSGLDEKPTVVMPSPFSTAGEYDIHLEGGFDNNYEYRLLNGKLTVKLGADGFYIFPNPTSDFVNIIFQQYPEKSSRFLLMDLHGKVLFSNQLMSDQNYYTIDLTTLSSGLYLYKIVDGSVSATGRILLHK